MPRQIKHEDDCRQTILRGMDAVADLVGSTLGPRGHTVIIGQPIGPAKVTKDGVTVAEGVSVPDPWENEGAKLIQQAARKTNTEAGDGTTAATILTRALYREGIRQVTAGADSQALERGMRLAVTRVVEELGKIATPVAQEDLATLEAVATVAANGDKEMGSEIAKAVHHAGLEGNYTLDPSLTSKTTFEIAKGLQFQRGLDKWPQFMNDQRGMAIFGACNIFITDMHLIEVEQAAALLRKYSSFGGMVPLLIICEDVSQGALQVLSANNGRSVNVCPVRAPGSGLEKKEILQDIAILTGSTAVMIARGDKIESVDKDHFGSADRVLVTPVRTTIVGGHGQAERVELRKDELRARIKDAETPEYGRAQLERRLAMISAKIAIIKLGAGVNSKLLEKRDRAEDSLNATLGALKEGIVPGGGVALIRTLPGLGELIQTMAGDEKIGAQVVASALTVPLATLAKNAGAKPDVVVQQVIEMPLAKRLEFDDALAQAKPGMAEPDGDVYPQGTGRLDFSGFGYNAARDCYEHLPAAGIIDPAKVVRLALENAVELSGLLITASGGVVEVPDPAQLAAMVAARQAAQGGRP
jgi:chaperonin GroEL